jgi:cyclopropane fatty-acyl-phospholipid synthase-like methyltransferase
MDTWKFYDITHREDVICNPTSEEKLARLVELLRLPADARVVDIACGKGEFLIRLTEAYGVRGMGIDISPFHKGIGRITCLFDLESFRPNAT